MFWYLKFCCIIILLISWKINFAQELFPSTEPASAMSARSIGIRLNNQFYSSNTKFMNRSNAEVMWGINKKWMMHFDVSASNYHQPNLKMESGSWYIKYRFLSVDEVQSHFRIAAYTKAAISNNAFHQNDVSFNGDNTGFNSGFIITQLQHKFAASITTGFSQAFNNVGYKLHQSQTDKAFNCSISAGYLLFPFHYVNYRQPNFNIYFELIGKNNFVQQQYYWDAAPAIQFIFNSIMRFDVIYQTQIKGTIDRQNKNAYSVRFEYNFLNAYKK
jgi:hypothetical protein